MATLLKLARAPIVLVSLLIGALLLFGFLSAVSIGEWFEIALQRLGVRGEPRWLMGLLGWVTFLGIGVFGSAVAASSIIGWPGAILGPIVTVLIISRLGNW